MAFAASSTSDNCENRAKTVAIGETAADIRSSGTTSKETSAGNIAGSETSKENSGGKTVEVGKSAS